MVPFGILVVFMTFRIHMHAMTTIAAIREFRIVKSGMFYVWQCTWVSSGKYVSSLACKGRSILI